MKKCIGSGGFVFKIIMIPGPQGPSTENSTYISNINKKILEIQLINCVKFQIHVFERYSGVTCSLTPCITVCIKKHYRLQGRIIIVNKSSCNIHNLTLSLFSSYRMYASSKSYKSILISVLKKVGKIIHTYIYMQRCVPICRKAVNVKIIRLPIIISSSFYT